MDDAADHLWIVSVTYTITAAQAEQLVATKRIDLPDEFAVLGPICYHCERMYEDAAVTCPGSPDADNGRESDKESLRSG